MYEMLVDRAMHVVYLSSFVRFGRVKCRNFCSYEALRAKLIHAYVRVAEQNIYDVFVRIDRVKRRSLCG